MQLSSSAGVNLTDEIIHLDQYDGSVKVNFSLEKPGYNTIRMKVIGVHKGGSRSLQCYLCTGQEVSNCGRALVSVNFRGIVMF